MSVIEVDCKTFPEAIKMMTNAMSSMSNNLSKINSELIKMNTSWSGKTYIELINLYNSFYDKTDIILSEGYKICKATEDIANYYSKVTLGSDVILDENRADCSYTFEKCSNEAGYNDSIYLSSSEVKKNKVNIDVYFNNIINKSTSFSNHFNSIVWNSPASTEFDKRVAEFKTNSQSWIKYVKSKTDKYIDDSIKKFGETEESNTVT